MVDLVDRINVMMEQESGVYKVYHYMAPEYQQQLATSSNNSDRVLVADDTSCSASSSSSGLSELWRERICEWSYQVIDHFDFSREVVSISIHYLDRFLCSRVVNKKIFQLAAMTSLYLAIKLFEPGRLSMCAMIELSRGYFLEDQMVAMERTILSTLAWKVHPPTPYCFAKHFLFVLPMDSVALNVRHEILELARFLTELSVIDYFFVVQKPSHVAIATIVNAMEDNPRAAAAIPDFVREMKKVLSIDITCDGVLKCCCRLRQLYVSGGYTRPQAQPRDESISPVSVYSFPQQQENHCVASAVNENPY